jgi:hypothetical protein
LVEDSAVYLGSGHGVDAGCGVVGDGDGAVHGQHVDDLNAQVVVGNFVSGGEGLGMDWCRCGGVAGAEGELAAIQQRECRAPLIADVSQNCDGLVE